VPQGTGTHREAPFQRTRASAALLGVGDDAVVLAERMGDRAESLGAGPLRS